MEEPAAFEDSFKDSQISVLNMSISNIITMSKIRIVLLNVFFELDQNPHTFRSGVRLLISYFILFKALVNPELKEKLSNDLDSFRAEVYRIDFTNITGTQFELLDKKFMSLFEAVTKAAEDVGLGFLKEHRITEKSLEDIIADA